MIFLLLYFENQTLNLKRKSFHNFLVYWFSQIVFVAIALNFVSRNSLVTMQCELWAYFEFSSDRDYYAASGK